jgi:glycosyltransferase involved in cell wall biosynthesis
MKILHLITTLSIGGAETMLYKLVTSMDRDKFEIQVVSLTDFGPIGGRIQDSGISVRSLDMKRGVPDPRMVFTLMRWLNKDRPDIIQTWMYHADLMGGLAAAICGRIPVAWGIHHSDLSTAGNKRTTLWTAKACARLSNRIPAKIICCSQAARDLHSRIGYDKNKMMVIPNGFDLDIFSPSKEARNKMRNMLKLSDQTLLIGLIARFDPQKDHKTFFQAAGILHQHYPYVHFLLCGNNIGWDNSFIHSWIEKADIRPVTHLIGNSDDMVYVQNALDIAVSSSYGEGFPNVLGEAMACGVPCVVTDVGDSARIVGDTGFVVPPRDSVALAMALKDMIELGEKRKKLGMLARKKIQNDFPLEKIVRQYEQLYLDLVRNTRH